MAAPRVVYQGEPGCYSEEAAVGFFGPEVSSRGLAWFPDVFAALERGEADYAVLPVENSSTGSIRQVYDLLAQYNYYVCLLYTSCYETRHPAAGHRRLGIQA